MLKNKILKILDEKSTKISLEKALLKADTSGKLDIKAIKDILSLIVIHLDNEENQ